MLLLQLLAVWYGLVVEKAKHAVLLQGFLVVLVIDIKNTVFPIILWELQALLGWGQRHEAQAREQEPPQGEHGPELPHAPRVGFGFTVRYCTTRKVTYGRLNEKGSGRKAAGRLRCKTLSVCGGSPASPVDQRNPKYPQDRETFFFPTVITPSRLLSADTKAKEESCQDFEVVGEWIPYIAAVLFPYPHRRGPFLGDQLFES